VNDLDRPRRVVVTSVVRHAFLTEVSGWLFVFDTSWQLVEQFTRPLIGRMEHEAVYRICPLPDEFGESRSPSASDSYRSWEGAALGPGVTPIPR